MESHKTVIEKVRKEYDLIVKVYCPVIKDDVHFNAKGFYHLRYEVTGRERLVKEQVHKLKLVKYLEQIVKNATIIHETRLSKGPVGRKKKAGKKILREIIYHAIVDTIVIGKSKKKIKIILRKVGNGNTIFWSVMKIK